jgi:hypothetical protein
VHGTLDEESGEAVPVELPDGLKNIGGRGSGEGDSERWVVGVEVGVISLASLDDFLGRGVWKGDPRPGDCGLRDLQTGSSVTSLSSRPAFTTYKTGISISMLALISSLLPILNGSGLVANLNPSRSASSSTF